MTLATAAVRIRARRMRASCCSRAWTTAASCSTPTTRAAKGRQLAAQPAGLPGVLLGARWSGRSASTAPWSPKCSAAEVRCVFRHPACRRAPVGARLGAKQPSWQTRQRSRTRCGQAKKNRKYGENPPRPATLGRLPRDPRRAWNSGRGARTACTTGFFTAARRQAAGRLSASLPDEVLALPDRVQAFLRAEGRARADDQPNCRGAGRRRVLRHLARGPAQRPRPLRWW